MKMICYLNGDASSRQEYSNVEPGDAARIYVEEWRDDIIDESDVVVEPIDEEAGALPWTTRPDGARVRMFRVTPIIRWEVEEVRTFAVTP